MCHVYIATYLKWKRNSRVALLPGRPPYEGDRWHQSISPTPLARLLLRSQARCKEKGRPYNTTNWLARRLCRRGGVYPRPRVPPTLEAPGNLRISPLSAIV